MASKSVVGRDWALGMAVLQVPVLSTKRSHLVLMRHVVMKYTIIRDKPSGYEVNPYKARQ